MNIKYLKNIAPVQDGAAKISLLSWSANNYKLAVATIDRSIVLFDDQGEKRDKFSTKASDSKYGKKSYVITGIAFSPDSSKIAIAQSDNIVYVYRIGDDWGEKKVICNKFTQSSQVTSVSWPYESPIIVGLLDGKVRVANTKTNKGQTLYQTDSHVVSLVPNLRGTGFLSGHADGSIVRFYTADDPNAEPQGKIISHSVPPYAMCWTNNNIIVAGSDKRVVMYSKTGKLDQQFDYTRNSSEKEFTAIACSPSGQAVVVGSYDRIRVYDFNSSKGLWEEKASKEIPGLYSITALAWKRDGSRLACGTLCGGVELFDTVLRRSVWKNKWEMTYVGPSQVLVKPLAGAGPHGSRGVILRSQYGFEIHDVKIMGKDRYLVARTNETILLGDLYRNLLSEVPAISENADEKFYFDNETVCMIFRAGELSLVEYGNNEVLESVRTEFMNPHLISVRINEREQRGVNENKKMAYLLDLKTIVMKDLITGYSLGQVNHDAKIDWLELNETGHKLLFRDKKLRLILVDVESLEKTQMLTYSTFVQWVTGSDVVVAQSRDQLCIWYNIDSPERKTSLPIKGEVIDIERADGRTEVIVQDGHQELSYALDEGLIEFRTAIDDGDFLRAMNYLESLPYTTESESMWRTLAHLSVSDNRLFIAERCFAALGDVAKVRYLQDINEIREKIQLATGEDGLSNYEVQAKLAILNKEFKTAEAIYVENGHLDTAIKMYQKLHKWDEAVELAELKGHPNVAELKREHMQWLLSTKQQIRAGQIKEKEGDLLGAISLYLSSGGAAKAANVILGNVELQNDSDLVTKIANSLVNCELFERAGDLYEKVGDSSSALDCYKSGLVYSKAVELARHHFPRDVITLEVEWGDELMQTKQPDAAISHYIEAGHNLKALEAAIAARQWSKAMQISEVIDDTDAIKHHLLKLSQHYSSLRDLNTAEKILVKGGMYKQAIEMYNQAGQWERSYQLASKHMKSDEVAVMYVNEAQKLQEEGKYRQAEKLYIYVNEPDLAITMYKKRRQFDQMMELVKQYHPDLVQSTHAHLASEMEQERNYKEAEKHYINAGDWKAAVNMYRTIDMWEDAYRVAKQEGGPNSAKQVAFLWAKTLRGDAAVKLLNKYAILEQCIDYCAETQQFEFGFELANSAMTSKVPELHYKYAIALEDEGKYADAEKHFIEAGKAKEAVLMYVHAQNWESAQRVAELHDTESVTDVLIGQAKLAFHEKDYPKAESLLLRAQKPELVIKFYKDTDNWKDALRVCKEYLPHKLKQLQDEYDKAVANQGAHDVQKLINQARQWEEEGEYERAVDCLVKINRTQTSDVLILEKSWTRAADMAAKFLSEDKANEVAKRLGPELLAMRRYLAAAQVFMSGDCVKESIDAFISAREWNKAKKVAEELEPRYESYVDNAYKDFLKMEGKAEELIDVDLASALEMYIEKGQWSRALEKAAAHGPLLLHKYLAQYATLLIKNEKSTEALSLYKKYGMPALKQNFNIYRRLVQEIIVDKSLSSGAESYRVWADLRDILYGLVSNLQQHADHDQEQMEFSELLQIVHYYANRVAARSTIELNKIAAKISISLLRHTKIVPPDKAFYEAGMDCKEIGWTNMAFVFLNRFLDVCEAIEDNSLDALDHTDFIGTDIPYEFPLPEQLNVADAEREAAKEWVLAVSMDNQVDQTLPSDERGVYDASLLNSNGSTSPACVVTGFPVFKDPYPLKHGQVANKDDWNKVLITLKISNSTELHDVIRYITNRGVDGSSNMVYDFQ